MGAVHARAEQQRHQSPRPPGTSGPEFVIEERKAGVDASRVREALLGGFAASRVLEVHGERILTGNFAPGFRTSLYQKDLRIAEETAEALGVKTPATSVVADMVNEVVSSGGGDLDYSAIRR